MAFFNCECKNNCTLFAFIASIFIGVLAAVLQYTAIITVAPPFYWAAFGIGIGFLALNLCGCGRCTERCGSSALTALLIGALGTILLSLILLGVGFAATSVVGAVFLGLLFFFFALLLGSAACHIRNRCTD